MQILRLPFLRKSYFFRFFHLPFAGICYRIVETTNINKLKYWCPLNLKLHFPVRYYSGQPIARMYSHAS